MAPSRPLLASCLTSALLLACATAPRAPASSEPRAPGPVPAPSYARIEKPRDAVDVRDTLPGFLATVGRNRGTSSAGIQTAWVSYERSAEEVLAVAGALPRDPGNVELRRMAASADAIVELVAGFERQAPGELGTLLEEMNARLGQVPRAVVAFAVSRAPQAFFLGELEGKPLLLVNARNPDLAEPVARQVALAKELFHLLHQQLQPDSPSLGPLAARVWRDGAALLAARQLVPGAFEPQLLGLSEERLARLRSREALVAQELLTALDSANPSEVARFFDPKVKDPLLPPGAGPFIADRLYQRLAAGLGSGVKPLQLPPTEFLAQARRELAIMAGVKP